MTEYLDADGDPLYFHPNATTEQKQAVAAQHARQREIRADLERRVRSLATESTQEQIETIRFILGQCSHSTDMLRYYEGIFASASILRFGTGGITLNPLLLGRQGVPGVDDVFVGMEEVLAPTEPAATEPTPPSPEPPSAEPPMAVHPDLLALGGDVGDVETPEPDAAIGVPGYATSDAGEAALMAQYNVEQVERDKPEVRCKGCGLVYVSLADRMVKEPDDCHGCVEKTKWG